MALVRVQESCYKKMIICASGVLLWVDAADPMHRLCTNPWGHVLQFLLPAFIRLLGDVLRDVLDRAGVGLNTAIGNRCAAPAVTFLS